MNSLRTIARQHQCLDGQVTFWLTPYRTLQGNVVIEAFEKVIPRVEWTYTHNVFVLFGGSVVDAEFHWQETATAEERSLEIYWRSRTGRVAADWPLFLMLSADLLNVLWTAYEATRDKALVNPNGANAAVDEPTSADPEAQPATANM